MPAALVTLEIARGAPVEVLRRVIGAAGAGADLPVDRIEDGLLLGELLARWAASADHVRVEVVGGERAIEVVVGPLSEEDHAGLVTALGLDADDSPTAAIVDEIRRDGTGGERRLRLAIWDGAVSNGGDRAGLPQTTDRHEQLPDQPWTDDRRPSSVSIRLPATAESLPVVRQALTGAAEDLGLATEVLDDVKIAVSEACNNAVVHAYPDGATGVIEVEIWTEPRRLLVEVRDWGVGMAPRSVDRVTGLGLGFSLMASLAEEVTLSRGGGEATVVRLGFATDAPPMTPNASAAGGRTD
jgi:serine/threonine-protein kinase RsbW